MQEAEVTKVTWSHWPRVGDREETNTWPELGQETQMRQFECENIPCEARALPPSAEENNERSPDEMEYPLVGVPSSCAKRFVLSQTLPSWKVKERRLSTPSSRRANFSINFAEALRNVMCRKKANLETAVRLNLNSQVPSMLSSNAAVKTLRRRFWRRSDSRIARLRRPIITADLNEINFSSLKITADPQLDVDYMHGMSTLNFYGKEYRSQFAGPFSRDTVGIQGIQGSDIIDKLNELHIQKRRQICNVRAINSATVSEVDTINEEILDGTVSLAIRDEDREIKDCAIPNNQNSVKYSRNILGYCTNVWSPTLNGSIDNLLCEIVRLHKKSYDKDKYKARIRKRYYSAFKECSRKTSS